LRLEQVTYQYTDQQQQGLVTIGPFDLTLRRSEIILIVGENGSGKSTLLKLLSGLYRPHSGKLYLNDQPVQCEQVYQQYTGLFSAVFADFHLFDRLYGLTEAAAADIPFWLQQMQLEDVVSFADGRFLSVHLSTGLRKRLACVVALIQQRPICVFDEVTADQDLAFRRHFYHQVLPLLQQRGYTVVLVSHDATYRHCADRLIRLDQGRIIEDLVLNKQN
jgi:putative ATP-binding cassette transporter